MQDRLLKCKDYKIWFDSNRAPWSLQWMVHTTLITLTQWGCDKICHCFPNDIFKCIFLNGNVWISIKISMKFVRHGPINNIPALVQIMAWRHPADKPIWTNDGLVYRCIYTPLVLNELKTIACLLLLNCMKYTSLPIFLLNNSQCNISNQWFCAKLWHFQYLSNEDTTIMH